MSAPEAAPFRLTRTNHHGLCVRSLPRSLSFYHTLLELPILSSFQTSAMPTSAQETFSRVCGVPNFTATLAFVGLPDGTALELVEMAHPTGKDASSYLTDMATAHFCFDVEGIEALTDAVKAWEGPTAGNEGVDGMTEEVVKLGKGLVQVIGCEEINEGDMKGCTVAFLKGPDGEILELMQTAAKL